VPFPLKVTSGAASAGKRSLMRRFIGTTDMRAFAPDGARDAGALEVALPSDSQRRRRIRARVLRPVRSGRAAPQPLARRLVALNAAVLVIAGAVLALSPVTVSSPVAVHEAIVLGAAGAACAA